MATQVMVAKLQNAAQIASAAAFACCLLFVCLLFSQPTYVHASGEYGGSAYSASRYGVNYDSVVSGGSSSRLPDTGEAQKRLIMAALGFITGIVSIGFITLKAGWQKVETDQVA